VLEAHAKVEEEVVVGLPTPFGDERVKAIVVSNSLWTEVEIIEHCRGQIADFKIPSLIEFRERLPRTPTGKIRRDLLLEKSES
jgi:acyl-coenzyme A synthetase/AMP-(fatty) acid ligase